MTSAAIEQKLSIKSPYHTNGPIKDPTQASYQNRHTALQKVQDQIQTNNILIVGARKRGKTSFAYEIHRWAKEQPNLQSIFIECASMSNINELNTEFRKYQRIQKWIEQADMAQLLRCLTTSGLLETSVVEKQKLKQRSQHSSATTKESSEEEYPWKFAFLRHHYPIEMW